MADYGIARSELLAPASGDEVRVRVGGRKLDLDRKLSRLHRYNFRFLYDRPERRLLGDAVYRLDTDPTEPVGLPGSGQVTLEPKASPCRKASTP